MTTTKSKPGTRTRKLVLLLSGDQRVALERISRESGIPLAVIARRALQQWLDHFDLATLKKSGL